MQNVLSYIDENRQRFIDELIDLLKIPSISAQSTRKPDCESAAEFIANQFRSLGLETEICPTPGNPVVLARHHAGDDKPTVLVYGHYDVQPEDPVELWNSPPFEPTITNGNIIARGATDDKGQMYAHVKSAEALTKAGGGIPVNVIYMIEGEEEISSVHLDQFIEDNKDKLKCDIAVISDTCQYGPGMPALCYGLRGIIGIEVRVEGAKQDLHSGQFGGAIANPIQVLCDLMAQMKDDKGRVTIPGFYDDVLDLETWEREAWAELPFDEKKFQSDLGVEKLFGEEGYSTLERKWARPTCELNGIFGGYSGEGAKTVLPAWAGAKVTMRLVPHQRANKAFELFETYIKKIAPPTVRIKVTKQGGGNPVFIPRDSDFVEQAVEALKQGFGAAPVFIREGGSIPVVSTMKEHLGVSTMLLGFGLPDDNCHAPNEKFSVEDYIRGIKTAATFLQLCGEK